MKLKRYGVYAILLIIVIVLIIIVPKTETEKAGLNKRKPVTITYAYCYSGETEALLTELIGEFNRTEGKRVGINVKPIYYGNVYLSDIVEETILGGLPNERICDINTVNYDTAYIAKAMSKIASPDEYLDSSVLDEYVQGYLERGRYTSDSNRSVFPLLNNTQVIYVNDVIWNNFKKSYPRYNDDVFETWEGIVEVSMDYFDWTDSLTPDVEGDGKAFILIDTLDYFFTGSNQLTASMIQPGHKEIRINLDREAIRTMWDTIYRGFLYGGISIANYDYKDSNIVKNSVTSYNLMADGKIACYIDSTDNVGKFPFAFKYVDAVKETSLKVYSYPTFKNSKRVSPISGAGLIVMKSNSVKEYASFYFLNWLVSQNMYVNLCYDNMALPAKSKSIASDYAEKVINEYLESKEIKRRYRGMVLRVASEQILSHESYAPLNFTKSTDFKNDIVKSFFYNVNDGIKELNLIMEEDVERKEALRLAITEDLFENWYNNITNIADKY